MQHLGIIAYVLVSDVKLFNMHGAWPAGPRGGSSSAWASLGRSAVSARRTHLALPRQSRPPASSTCHYLATSLSMARSWLRPAWRTWLR